MSICKTCGKEIPADARFCTYCGSLQDSPASEEKTKASVSLTEQSPPAPAEKTDAAPKEEAPKVEAPKAELPKTEAPKAEAPKAELPKTEAPKAQNGAPLSPMPSYPQAPKAPAPKNYGGDTEYAPKYRPLGAWAYFWLSVLFSVPVVGFVFMIVFSCNGNHINRRNFARSYLIRLIFAVLIGAVTVLLCMLLINLGRSEDLGYWLSPFRISFGSVLY